MPVGAFSGDLDRLVDLTVALLADDAAAAARLLLLLLREGVDMMMAFGLKGERLVAFLRMEK